MSRYFHICFLSVLWWWWGVGQSWFLQFRCSLLSCRTLKFLPLVPFPPNTELLWMLFILCFLPPTEVPSNCLALKSITCSQYSGLSSFCRLLRLRIAFFLVMVLYWTCILHYLPSPNFSKVLDQPCRDRSMRFPTLG